MLNFDPIIQHMWHPCCTSLDTAQQCNDRTHAHAQLVRQIDANYKPVLRNTGTITRRPVDRRLARISWEQHQKREATPAAE